MSGSDPRDAVSQPRVDVIEGIHEVKRRECHDLRRDGVTEIRVRADDLDRNVDRAGASGRQNEEECAPPLGRRSDMRREGKSYARKGTREATKFAPFRQHSGRTVTEGQGQLEASNSSPGVLSCGSPRRCSSRLELPLPGVPKVPKGRWSWLASL
jgi:hypothetical protein